MTAPKKQLTSAEIRAEAELRNLARWGQRDFPSAERRAEIDAQRNQVIEGFDGWPSDYPEGPPSSPPIREKE